MKNIRLQKQSGAVSLFVVIFAMLIITVLTISFMRLMMADQRQATNDNLSQSAYDSAQAGVEDAKRALLLYQRECSTTPGVCASRAAEISDTRCNMGLVRNGLAAIDAVNSNRALEVKVQQNSSSVDAALDQAYTCVVMQLITEDYVGSVKPGESKLIPLIGQSDFDTVTISWFDDRDTTGTNGTLDYTPDGNGVLYPQTASSGQEWSTSKPSVMRAQVVQFGDSFTLDQFDYVTSSAGVTQSNTNTVFMYPTRNAATTSGQFTGLDTRKDSPTDEPDPDTGTTPARVQCQPNVSSGNYACTMSLRLPQPMGGGDRTAFLKLSPYYNAAHFKVVLSNGVPAASGAGVVRFQDVQPAIDSTGRANDLFRRLTTRVDLYNTNFPFPEGTIDVTGNFCKDFSVTDDPAVYTSSLAQCTP